MEKNCSCKCVLCINKNPDSILVTKLLFTHHRKKEQLDSIKDDDENINQIEVHD